MNSKVSEIVKIYKELSSIASPVSATILPGLNKNVFSIQTKWNATDLIKLESTSFNRQYLGLKKNEKFEFLSCGIASELNSINLSAFSKDGRKQAVLQKKGKSEDDHQFIEVWSSTRKEATFDMHNKKEHGKIIDNDPFGCFEWSSNAKYLLYVAEKKQPKTESYFTVTSEKSDDDKPSEVTKGEEFIFREDWGERLVGIHHPIVCILDLETGLIETFNTTETENLSGGQAVWGPNDESIIFVGWSEFPRRLGPMFCDNRRTAIYSIDVKSKKIECISGDGEINVRSPRFNPSYSSLIYLQNKASGPHRMCSKIVKYDWATKALSLLIDIVEHAADNQFPGIFCEKFPNRCWSEDGKYIFFSTPWRSKLMVTYVNVEDSTVDQLLVDECFGSCNVLDVKNDIVIASVSSPNTEPCLVAGKIHQNEKLSISWTYLDLNTPVKISGIKWTIKALKPTCVNEMYPDVDYEMILIAPEKKSTDVPLIVCPHGGPHSVYPASFYLNAAAFAKLGYAMCLVNYRGSIGFGENSVKSLLGNIGIQDVQDVQNTVEYLKKESDIKFSEFILLGASHGGFLAAHLSGQYPDFYKAAILHNPVIEISGMVEATDIPDWTYTEVGQGDKFDFTASASPEMLKDMWEKSPIKYINNVTIPTLFLIGKNDLRVPPTQGLKFYHILKARNVPVSIYRYDDNHALGKPASASDSFMQKALWIMKHTSSV